MDLKSFRASRWYNHKMSGKQKAIVAIVIASLFWSTAGLSKILIKELDPYFAGFLRFFVASLIILPFFLKEKVSWKTIKNTVPITLAGCANVVLYFIGLQTSTASAAVLIYAGVPLVTAVFAKFFLYEPITSYKITGLLTGLAGVFYITLLPAWEKGTVATGAFPGNYFFLLAIFTWALYLTGSRYLLNIKKYSPIIVTGISFFVNCFVFLIFAIFTFQPLYVSTLMKPGNLLLTLHIGIFVSVVPFLLLQWALTKTSASTSALSNYLQPLFALIINATILGEILSINLAFGGLLVFIGITIASGLIKLRPKK